MPDPVNAPYDSPIDPQGSDPANLTNDEVDDLYAETDRLWRWLFFLAVFVVCIAATIVFPISNRLKALERPAPPPSDARIVNAP